MRPLAAYSFVGTISLAYLECKSQRHSNRVIHVCTVFAKIVVRRKKGPEKALTVSRHHRINSHEYKAVADINIDCIKDVQYWRVMHYYLQSMFFSSVDMDHIIKFFTRILLIQQILQNEILRGSIADNISNS